MEISGPGFKVQAEGDVSIEMKGEGFSIQARSIEFNTSDWSAFAEKHAVDRATQTLLEAVFSPDLEEHFQYKDSELKLGGATIFTGDKKCNPNAVVLRVVEGMKQAGLWPEDNVAGWNLTKNIQTRLAGSGLFEPEDWE